MGQPIRLIQSNFSGGEASPRSIGRRDVERYFSSTALMQNMRPVPQGGVVRRSGTRFVAEVKDSADIARLIPFRYGDGDSYVLELGDAYQRVYRERAQVISSTKTVTGVTKANPGEVTAASHGFSTGDQVYLDGIVGMTELNGRRFTVTSTGANTFTIGVNTTGYTTYSSGGTASKIHEATTPWADDDLYGLRWTQSANTLYVAHPDYHPQTVTRTSAHAGWTIGKYLFEDGPYLDLNETATTLTPSATTGSVTIAASASLFASTDVGRLVRMLHGGTWGSARITAYTSATQVSATVERTLGGTGAVTTWRLGVWSDTTGWPSAVGFFQQRLFWANNTIRPSSVWGSKSDAFLLHAPTDASGTVADNDGINYTIADNMVNAFYDIQPGENFLMLFSGTSVWSLAGGSGGVLAPTAAPNVSKLLEYGISQNVPTARIGGSVMFASPSGRAVRSISYDARRGGYVAPRNEIFSEHITKGGLLESAVQREIDQIVYYTREDGELVGNLWNSDEDINAWFRYVIGGDGEVESVAIIPNPDVTKADDVWLVVKRTINGQTRRFVEYIEDDFDPAARLDGLFLDCALTYDGRLAATLTPGAATGTGVTFTASASVFTASMVGQKIFKYDSDFRVTGIATITAQAGTTATVTITASFGDTSVIASGSWAVAKNTFSQFWHLEGETIVGCGDGAVTEELTVEDGIVTTEDYYGVFHAGYPYTSVLKGLPMEETRFGTIAGAVTKIEGVILYLINSVGFKYGKDAASAVPVKQRDYADYMDTALPLYTGTVRVAWPDGHNKNDRSYYIEQSDPLPLEVAYAVIEARVG